MRAFVRALILAGFALTISPFWAIAQDLPPEKIEELKKRLQPENQAIADKLLFYEPFDDNRNNWPVTPTGPAARYIKDGVYVLVDEHEKTTSANSRAFLGDFVFQITFSCQGTSDEHAADAHVAVRLTAGGPRCHDLKCFFGRPAEFNALDFDKKQRLDTFCFGAQILRFGTGNIVEGRCIGDRIRFWLNGEPTPDMIADALPSRYCQLWAGASPDYAVRATFDDFIVFSVKESKTTSATKPQPPSTTSQGQGKGTTGGQTPAIPQKQLPKQTEKVGDFTVESGSDFEISLDGKYVEYTRLAKERFRNARVMMITSGDTRAEGDVVQRKRTMTVLDRTKRFLVTTGRVHIDFWPPDRAPSLNIAWDRQGAKCVIFVADSDAPETYARFVETDIVPGMKSIREVHSWFGSVPKRKPKPNQDLFQIKAQSNLIVLHGESAFGRQK